MLKLIGTYIILLISVTHLNPTQFTVVLFSTQHKLLLLHNVNFPTTGSDTPHLLDLLITDDQFVCGVKKTAKSSEMSSVHPIFNPFLNFLEL